MNCLAIRGRVGFFLSLSLSILAGSIHAEIEGATAVAASPVSTLDEGNRAFESGDFPTAITAFEQVVESGHLSPDLFLLLGNAHYRSGSNGAAALWWRRAQIMDPLCAEAAQNLRFLERKAGFLYFKSDTLGSVTGLLPRNGWLIAGTAGIWAFILAIVSLSLHLPRKLWRTISHVICWVGFAFALIGIAGYLVKTRRDIPHISALAIINQATTAHASATDDGATVIEVPAGSEVTMLGERGPWTYIGIPGNLRGWIRTGTALPLWPFDPASIQ